MATKDILGKIYLKNFLIIFDNSSSDRFNYYNYPALSPSSAWVQTNFKKGKSGVILFNYTEQGKEIKELLFDWKREYVRKF